jgi:hypothetical protein
MNEPDDSNNNNNLYALFAFFAVVLVGIAYARVPPFREFADAKAPWFKQNIGHYLVGSAPGGDARATGGDAQTPGGDAADPNSVTGKKGVDFADFAAHPASWPKTLAIKVDTQFPAVINNKMVGSVRAPAGSEVHLVSVENGKLGVEYRGGGAWVKPEATDLSERVPGIVLSTPAPGH